MWTAHLNWMGRHLGVLGAVSPLKLLLPLTNSHVFFTWTPILPLQSSLEVRACMFVCLIWSQDSGLQLYTRSEQRRRRKRRKHIWVALRDLLPQCRAGPSLRTLGQDVNPFHPLTCKAFKPPARWAQVYFLCARMSTPTHPLTLQHALIQGGVG